MKHSANIQANVSRAYALPLLTRDSAYCPEDIPTFDGEWHPLPEQFLTSIDFLARFHGSTVYVAQGKAYAGDNVIALEYDAGAPCQFDLALTPKEVRAIKAFGTAPSHAFASAFPGTPQHFRWATGGSLALPYAPPSSGKAASIRSLLSGFDWGGLHDVDAMWCNQVIGHFAFKTARGDTGLLWIHPGRIVGGIFDHRLDVELVIETFTDREVVFSKEVFLSVLKVATAIKFVTEDDRTHLLFRGENIRGVAIGMRKVAS